MTKPTFGQRLVALREDRGWSRNQLHIESGVGYSYLRAIENDEWLPGEDHLVAIVDALGPKAHDLLEFRDQITFERLELDPEAAVMLKEISGDMTERDRRDLEKLHQQIKQRQKRRA